MKSSRPVEMFLMATTRGELADPNNDEEFAGKKERGRPPNQLFPVWTDEGPVSLRELYPDPVSDGGWYGELDMDVWNRSIHECPRLMRRVVMTWLFWAMRSDENKDITMKVRGCKLERRGELSAPVYERRS